MGRRVRARLCLVLTLLAASACEDGPPGEWPLGYRLVVKFRDELKLRAEEGRLVARTDVDLAELQRLLDERRLRVQPLIALPEARLARLEARARERSRAAQPDLAGFIAVGTVERSPAQLEELRRLFSERAEVQVAYVQVLGLPPPQDLPPPTPSYVALQKDLGPDPGLDANHAWSLGARGSGVRLSDCEYGWDPKHEDLSGLHVEPNQTVDPNVFVLRWHHHGTEVVGTISAAHNPYGCSGLAPDAEVHAYPEWTVQDGFRGEKAVARALEDSRIGDVVLLEIHGPKLGPAELEDAVWQVVKLGTDAGVVVVAAAGNGSRDLDTPEYDEYRRRGDSGAILVGAGTADAKHDKLSLSSFGARVDVQGWGHDVFTLGDGSFKNHGAHQEYTSSFYGTSAAAAQVAGACAIVQSYALALGLPPLDSRGMRELLVATGVPQGQGGHIGPLPNLKAALAHLEAQANPPQPP